MDKDREFWLIIYRHLFGILQAIKDMKLSDYKKVETTNQESTTVTPEFTHKV